MDRERASVLSRLPPAAGMVVVVRRRRLRQPPPARAAQEPLGWPPLPPPGCCAPTPPPPPSSLLYQRRLPGSAPFRSFARLLARSRVRPQPAARPAQPSPPRELEWPRSAPVSPARPPPSPSDWASALSSRSAFSACPVRGPRDGETSHCPAAAERSPGRRPQPSARAVRRDGCPSWPAPPDSLGTGAMPGASRESPTLPLNNSVGFWAPAWSAEASPRRRRSVVLCMCRVLAQP